ncbi:unnamed protein product [Lactuca virosa]|nr:unnamed protein product [Lactuca virosa]
MEDDPFDFESDALLASSPVVAPKKRKKVIGLDDLLVDHYKEKNRVIERESKIAKTKKAYNSDDEEDGRVAKLSKYVDECHEKMTKLSDEDDVSIWGLQVFGNQKSPPSFEFTNLQSCSIFHSFLNHEVNSLVELSTKSGEIFFEGLLTNGWLLKLVQKYGKVEKSIATWTFHLMLYSSKEALRSAAVNFWCAILLKNEGESLSLKIDWLPTYLELNGALETYGYLLNSPKKDSCDTEMDLGDSEHVGPPQNIRAWIKYISTCSQARKFHFIFSTSEVEELVVVIVRLMLDRQLLGLSVDLYECMISLINFFKDEEWSASCTKISKSIASR